MEMNVSWSTIPLNQHTYALLVRAGEVEVVTLCLRYSSAPDL